MQRAPRVQTAPYKDLQALQGLKASRAFLGLPALPVPTALCPGQPVPPAQRVLLERLVLLAPPGLLDR